MRILLAIIFLLTTVAVGATHNRGGEITYVHVSGNTYRFTITTCTKSSVVADRSELEITWGDGSPKDTVLRSLITPIAGADAQKNFYVLNHTFIGAGTFRITMELELETTVL